MRLSVPASKRLLAYLAIVCLFLLSGCVGVAPFPAPTAAGEVRPDAIRSYLPPDQEPDSLTLLPPPPTEGSAAYTADQEAFRTMRQLINGPRWALAARDAELHPEAFSCAMGAPITQALMPHLYTLMERTLKDAGSATNAAKNHYGRPRPFVVNRETSCKPEDETALAKNGSYPSGHSSAGWAWALILAEIAPDRADAIFSRGYSIGWSRVVCGVHWQSDVDAGRVIGAAVVARLHADPVFEAQLGAARKELAAARARGLKPAEDCQAESSALAR